MNIEELLNEWAKDAEIDDNHLDQSAIKTSKLHAKYLNHLIHAKLRLSKTNHDYKTLRTKKFKYYRGEMTKAELLANGWTQWEGVKPIKSEMEEFLQGDSELSNMNLKIEGLQTLVLMLESILNQLKSRDWQIRNSITWKQFLAGN